MPNWCFTSYVIVGKTKDVEKINNAVVNHPVKDGSAENWQGNILHALGMSYEEIDKHRLRGFHYDRDYIGKIGNGESQLKLSFEEAWCRTEFAEMLEKLFPEISIYWQAEESGCEIYQTNDSGGNYFPDRYFVDTCINGEYDSEYFVDRKDAFKWISEKSGCYTEKEVEEWNDKAESAGTDDFIYVHEFDVL